MKLRTIRYSGGLLATAGTAGALYAVNCSYEWCHLLAGVGSAAAGILLLRGSLFQIKNRGNFLLCILLAFGCCGGLYGLFVSYQFIHVLAGIGVVLVAVSILLIRRSWRRGWRSCKSSESIAFRPRAGIADRPPVVVRFYAAVIILINSLNLLMNGFWMAQSLFRADYVAAILFALYGAIALVMIRLGQGLRRGERQAVIAASILAGLAVLAGVLRKVGAEGEAPDCTFQLTQRFDFLAEVAGWETVSVKNFINTRDEALGDRQKFARFHQIWSDCNVLEFAIFLKFGICQVLLALIEEEHPMPDLCLKAPLEERHPVGRDLTFARRLMLADGRAMTALQVQLALAEAASEALRRGCAANAVPDAERIVALWRETLDDLLNRRHRLCRRLDWLAKLQILRRLEEAAGDTPQALVSADLRFAELGGFFEELERERAVDRLEEFLGRPAGARPVLAPREQLRAALIERFSDQLVLADWDWLVLRSCDDATLWEIELDFDSAPACLRALDVSPTPSCAFARLKELGFLTRYHPPREEHILASGGSHF